MASALFNVPWKDVLANSMIVAWIWFFGTARLWLRCWLKVEKQKDFVYCFDAIISHLPNCAFAHKVTFCQFGRCIHIYSFYALRSVHLFKAIDTLMWVIFCVFNLSLSIASCVCVCVFSFYFGWQFFFCTNFASVFHVYDLNVLIKECYSV